jgi:hypothetical protein
LPFAVSRFVPVHVEWHICGHVFLGENAVALGFGVAALQAPPLVIDKPADPAADRNFTSPSSAPVANPQRPDPHPFLARMTVM